MKDLENQLPRAMSDMARDLGIDQDQFNNLGFNEIFKNGQNTALALTKISNIYNLNAQNSEKIIELQNEIKILKTDLDTKTNEVIALQKANNQLEISLIQKSNTGENSILSTILFSLSSLLIGVCGSLIASKSYAESVIFGLVGISLSIIAACLIIPRKNKDA